MPQSKSIRFQSEGRVLKTLCVRLAVRKVSRLADLPVTRADIDACYSWFSHAQCVSHESTIQQEKSHVNMNCEEDHIAHRGKALSGETSEVRKGYALVFLLSEYKRIEFVR